MKKKYTPKLFVLLISFALGTSFFNETIAQQNNKFGMLTFNKAVNISGKQRMLTQKMAKSYLYLVSNPNDISAKRDLMTSKIIFEKQNGIINKNSSYKLTKDRLSKVETLWADYKKILDSKPTLDNAKKLIEMNTDLLKASNSVVSAVIVESKGVNQESEGLFEEDNTEADSELKQIINMAGRQRMLSQRLALYYFANDATLKDKNNEQMLKNVFNELDGAITVLLISNFNNSQIEEKLGIAMSRWEIIKNNQEKLFKQGFKKEEMYALSNELTKAFNAVTGLYEKVKL